jgi:hypothetical protein
MHKRWILAVLLAITLQAAALALAAPPRFPDQITVYAIPAPRPAELSWESPGRLVRSVLVNTAGAKLGLMTRTLGHMGVHVQCGREEWKGSMTNSVDSEFTDIVVKQKYGLGVLFHNFSGRFERPEELQKSLDERYRNGRVAWVRIGLRPETCARILKYIREFDARKVHRYYGLAARPLYGEGAGCSAFSMSTVEVAGVMEPAFLKHWTFDVRVPLALIGGPLTGKKVSIFKAAATTRPWAKPSEPHKRIWGWDPTLAYYWISDAVARVGRGAKPVAAPVVTETRGKAVGLVLDRRHVPTPTGPIWKP